jgi:hypothetical protein
MNDRLSFLLAGERGMGFANSTGFLTITAKIHANVLFASPAMYRRQGWRL